MYKLKKINKFKTLKLNTFKTYRNKKFQEQIFYNKDKIKEKLKIYSNNNKKQMSK